MKAAAKNKNFWNFREQNPDFQPMEWWIYRLGDYSQDKGKGTP
jgi:hypothetical protein